METTRVKQTKNEDRVIRLLSKDIEGKMSVYSGLTRIKGISWAISGVICKKLGLNKNAKIGTLNDDELKKIEGFVAKPDFPKFLMNRQKDFETGEDKHLNGTGLELQKEFDIKRLKKIKSYRGVRHNLGLPSRGQRTRSNFRPNRRKGAGIKKK
jgi:small subunit ribosomal protein S13